MSKSAPILCLLSLVAAAPRPARAEPAPRKLVLELAKLVQPEESYASTIDQVETQLIASLQAQGVKLPPDAGAKLKRAVMEILPYNEMLDWYVEVYSPRFTGDEIQQLITFYRTPAGKKLARMTPEIGGEVGKKLGTIMPQRLPAALKKYGLTP
jgi:hypothetical protein